MRPDQPPRVGDHGVAQPFGVGGLLDQGVEVQNVVVNQGNARVVDKIIEAHGPHGNGLVEQPGLLPADGKIAERNDGDGDDEQRADAQLQPDGNGRGGSRSARVPRWRRMSSRMLSDREATEILKFSLMASTTTASEASPSSVIM